MYNIISIFFRLCVCDKIIMHYAFYQIINLKTQDLLCGSEEFIEFLNADVLFIESYGILDGCI